MFTMIIVQGEWAKVSTRNVIRLVLVMGTLALAGCASQPRGPAGVDTRAASSSSSRSSSENCGRSYTVRRGDSLSTIAARCGVEWRELARENNIRSPYSLNPGQTLTLPGPSTYRVQRGDNLYRIALNHGLSTHELASLNGISTSSTIYPGQELRVRGTARAQRTTPPPSRRVAQTPPPSTYSPPVTTPSPGRPPARVEQQDPQLGAGVPRFTWPVDGQVLEGFGPQSSGKSNDGIKIAVEPGAPVRVAADGSVVYAGSELQGYGNLVLVRHSGGYVTAYAHNSVLRVAEGAQVRSGDIIAQAGSSGSADRPMLHFEIRRNVTPVNPLELLPNR